jgi:hypothetical protein
LTLRHGLASVHNVSVVAVTNLVAARHIVISDFYDEDERGVCEHVVALAPCRDLDFLIVRGIELPDVEIVDDDDTARPHGFCDKPIAPIDGVLCPREVSGHRPVEILSDNDPRPPEATVQYILCHIVFVTQDQQWLDGRTRCFPSPQCNVRSIIPPQTVVGVRQAYCVIVADVAD